MRKNREVFVFKNTDGISEFAITMWTDIARKAIKNKGFFTVALSGGQTPKFLYKKLAEKSKKLPWNKTHIFLVDERFVSVNDPYSNYRMIKKDLLDKVTIPKRNIHPVAVKDTVKASACDYQKEIKDFLNLKKDRLPSFDLITLGIGGDGHTASLFPSDAAVHQKKALITTVSRGEVKCERITMTFPVINNSKNIIFMVTGKNKSKVLKDVLAKPNFRLPASLVGPKKGKLTFLVDTKAGASLDNSSRRTPLVRRGSLKEDK
jgi:6-phosphogluconolactonase